MKMENYNYWSDEKSFKLINFVKKYPVLWNSALYSTKRERLAYWNVIADKLGFTVVSCNYNYKLLNAP